MVALSMTALKCIVNQKVAGEFQVTASMHCKTFTISVLLLCAGWCLQAWAQQPDAPTPYRNPKLPPAQRAEDLIAHMTLEEKVSQLVHTADAIPRLGVPAYNWWN